MPFVSIFAIFAAASLLGPDFAFADDAGPGARIYRTECATCHGEQARGGKGGEYPRLAGQHQAYLEQQLAAFRDRKRRNKPMLPIFKAGKLSTPAIETVAAYLAGLAVPEPAEVGVSADVAGDLQLGREIYEADCQLCHGPAGRGNPEKGSPQLIAQYRRYIAKQMADFRNGERAHEHAEQMFGEAYPDELDAVLAYILSLNHLAPDDPRRAAAP